MQHFVIKHVPQKPNRHERLVQRGIDSNDLIFFLDCSKDELFSRTVLSPASPDNLVSAKAPPKVPLVSIVKNRTQIEVCPLVAQIQWSLHRQLRVRQLSLVCFAFNNHCDAPKGKRET